jgi:hypothetical protein
MAMLSTAGRCNARRMVVALLSFLTVFATVWPLTAFAQSDEESIVGTYTVVITEPDIPKDIPNGPTLLGRWQIQFNEDGTYTTSRTDVGEMVAGSYTVEGNKVTITDERGLLSCANASPVGSIPDAETGTYGWQKTDQRINFTLVEDNCAGRKILLTTRQLEGFVSCSTTPLDLGAAMGTPVAGAASPVAEPPLAEASPVAEASPAAEEDVAKAIDDLLNQMTSCWATGDPARFLPLLTEAFRAQFLAADTSGNPIETLAAVMQATPFEWSRSGSIRDAGNGHITALVRQSVGGQIDDVRYDFVIEDGQWKWNGTG